MKLYFSRLDNIPHVVFNCTRLFKSHVPQVHISFMGGMLIDNPLGNLKLELT